MVDRSGLTAAEGHGGALLAFGQLGHLGFAEALALVKYLDQMSDDEVVGLNIPTGIPLRYDLDSQLRPRVAGGTYLDPDAAAAGAAAVAGQGAK